MLKQIVVLFALLLFFVGCGNKNNNQETKPKSVNGLVKYMPADSSYSIGFPESWEVKKGRQSFQLMALSPVKDSTDMFREDVIIFREKYPKGVTDIDGYLNYSLKKIPTLLKNFKEGNSGKTKINGNDSRWFEYTFIMNGKRVQKCLAYIFEKDKYGYVVLSSAVDSTYEAYNPVFKKISKTFNFTNKQ
jgi:hypothetical protein